MKTETIKNFLKAHCCTLVLVLALLPEFDLVAMMTGIDLNVAMIITQLVCVVGIGMSLMKLMAQKRERQEPLPVPFMALNGGGAFLALLSLIPSMPDWMGYVALIALFVSLFMTKNIWLVQWQQMPTQGAFLILLALLMHIFNFVNNTTATSVAAFIGLFLYFKGLSQLKSGMDQAGLEAADKLKLAIILSIIAVVLDLIPMMGWLAVIFSVLAFVFEFMGYGRLSCSAVVGAEGARGAGMLRNSMIVMVVAAVCSLFLDALASFVALAALLMAFSGWVQVIMGIESSEQTIY